MKKLLVLLSITLSGCIIQVPDDLFPEKDAKVDDPKEDATVEPIEDADVETPKDAKVKDVEAPKDAIVDAKTDEKDAFVEPEKDSGGPVVVEPGTVPRPATSHGVGFYVVGNKLYDANGKEFIMMGNNKTHQDFYTPGLNLTKSNTNRWIIYFSDDPNRAIRDMNNPNLGGAIPNKMVQIPSFWDSTCSNDPTKFENIVKRWVRDAKIYQTIEKYTILGIANEYSPSSDEEWRDKYVDAIKRIRAAGFLGAVQIDGRGCGQLASPIIKYGKTVLEADPEKNVHFSVHTYGMYYSNKYGMPKTWDAQQDLIPTFDALKATGLHIVLGEVGAGPKLGGGNGGPSPTKISATAFTEEALARGFGVLYWSYDDNTLAGGKCNNDSFCMVYDPSKKELGSNLTDWGKEAVQLWDKYAKPASIF